MSEPKIRTLSLGENCLYRDEKCIIKDARNIRHDIPINDSQHDTPEDQNLNVGATISQPNNNEINRISVYNVQNLSYSDIVRLNCNNSSHALVTKPNSDLASAATTVKPQLTTVKTKPTYERIFVSRFHPETTVEDINRYLIGRIRSSFRVYKCKTRYDTYSSFCISVHHEELFPLLDHCFWPDGTLVRKFYPSNYSADANLNAINGNTDIPISQSMQNKSSKCSPDTS